MKENREKEGHRGGKSHGVKGAAVLGGARDKSREVTSSPRRWRLQPGRGSRSQTAVGAVPLSEPAQTRATDRCSVLPHAEKVRVRTCHLQPPHRVIYVR